VRSGRGIFLAGIAAVALLCALAPNSNAARVGYDAAIIVVAAVTWRAGRRPGNDALAWSLMAGGMTCWVVGDLIWDGYAYLDWSRPGVSIADVLYLAGYPLFAAGILRILALRTPGRYREGLLDGISFAIAAAIATWALLVVPTTRDAGLLDAIVWGAYPFADVLLLAAVAWLVLTPGRRSAPTWLLLFFLGATWALDVLWSAVPLVNENFNIDLLNAGYPIAYAGLAFAAAAANSSELTAPTTMPNGRMHPARFLLLGFALMTAPCIAIGTTSISTGSKIFLFASSTLLAVIVLARFRIAVREREEAHGVLEFQADHDHLTGLYNRRPWVEHLERRLERARHTANVVAVMYIDLDGFKPVNDNWGHATGDELLAAVGDRIRSVVRPRDVVARLGGDEFAVCCDDLASVDDAHVIMARVAESISQPFELGERVVNVSASIGLSTSVGVEAAEVIMREADAAMYEAKQSGRSRREQAQPAPV
jgi:diguanylate cyclase (GGDEF)-like protein